MRARSSAGEHYLDMVGVTGSIPVAPTMLRSRSERRMPRRSRQAKAGFLHPQASYGLAGHASPFGLRMAQPCTPEGRGMAPGEAVGEDGLSGTRARLGRACFGLRTAQPFTSECQLASRHHTSKSSSVASIPARALSCSQPLGLAFRSPVIAEAAPGVAAWMEARSAPIACNCLCLRSVASLSRLILRESAESR